MQASTITDTLVKTETTIIVPLRKKGRLGNRKSANGCITCKIRRIKCDEEWPACKRCTSTGRTCDGYKRSSPPSTAPVLGLPVCGLAKPSEARHYEFFIYQVVPGLPTTIDEDFWHKIIPQFSVSETVVWDAVTAMSILLQQARSPKQRIATFTDSQMALRSYNKSVTGLQAQLKLRQAWSVTCSITCIIYICIECLLGNHTEAMAIYRRALILMSGARHSPRLKDEAKINGAVLTLLEHMALSRGQANAIEKVALKPGVGYESMRLARKDLNTLMAEAHIFVCDVEEVKLAHAFNNNKFWEPPLQWIEEHQNLMQRMRQWRLAIKCTEASLDRDEQELYHVGILAYEQYYVWVGVVLSMFETANDEYFENFANMIYHAEQLLKVFRGVDIAFSFETRFIPMVGIMAHKCRHPILRRQAIDLLHRGPQRENLWTAENEVRAAWATVAFEESGDVNIPFQQVPPPSVPSEERRVFKRYDMPPNRMLFGTWKIIDGQWMTVEHVAPF